MGLFSSQNDKQVKLLSKIADRVDALDADFSKKSDKELREMTLHFKERLNKGETLDDILPEAFATVREAAWRVIKQKHYYVQILGGIALHQGRICQMSTGEGKTLVSTMPAYLNALNGKGVHVVTVNSYLAKRDAEWMGKIYKFLGLTVGVIDNKQSSKDKQQAYNCDITYGTNNEYGFDYLRDNMQVSKNDIMQRSLEFAIVDEVDSILIDEARTPLIIAGKGEQSSASYIKANQFVKTLKGDDYEHDEKDKAVRLTDSGVEKAESYFSVANLSDIENTSLNHFINQALRAHVIMKRDSDYIVEKGEIIIVDEFTGRKMEGRRYNNGLHQAIEAKENVKVRDENKTLATISFQNLFRLYRKLSGMTGTAKTEEAEFNSIYGLDVVVIPTNKPCIRDDFNDVIYSTEKGKFRNIVADVKKRNENGQPVLIGTVTVERSEMLSDFLKREGVRHNVLNAKNHKLEAEIVAQAGKKGAVTIATNMAGRGTDILLGGNPEFMAKQEMSKSFSEEQIEIATSYAEGDEETTKLQKIFRELLEKYTKITEAEKTEVIGVGGLHIIGTERHESRRIDDQLRGRAGRQGDPGSSVFFISLEDDLARVFGGDKMKGWFDFFKVDEDTPVANKMITKTIENAQKNIESIHFSSRKSVLQYDDVFNVQRNLIYEERKKALNGENIHDDIKDMMLKYIDRTFEMATHGEKDPKKWDLKHANLIFRQHLPLEEEFLDADYIADKKSSEIYEEWKNEVMEFYAAKCKDGKDDGIDYDEVERHMLLRNMTSKWIDHIDVMEQLKQDVRLQAYGNKDPLVLYKQQGYDLFEKLQEDIQFSTIRFLLLANVERRIVKPRQEDSNEEKDFNKPCPCGSGNKYKNCCGKNAHREHMEKLITERKAQRKK